MRKYTVIGLLFVGLLATPGCYYDNEEALYPNSFCDTANITYANTIQPLVTANCATNSGCHVAGGDGTGDFTNFTDLQTAALSGSLMGSVNQTTDYSAMPPDGKLPSCLITKLQKWVDRGAPND